VILSSISIDIDGLDCYERIYGLPSLSQEKGRMVKTVVPIWLDYLEKRDLKGTFFLIGKDIINHSALVKSIVAAGHEIGNHSWSHPYSLPYFSQSQIKDQLEKCDTILRSMEVNPVGFRTPGYHLSSNIIKQLKELNYKYSSSMLGSWSYWSAKAIVKKGISLWGSNKSASSSHPITDLLSPPNPYYPSLEKPWQSTNLKDENSILEIPISTGPSPLNIPATGNFLFLLKNPHLFYSSKKSPFILNLHGIDLWPDDAPIETSLRKRERHLNIPLNDRIKLIDNLINHAEQRGSFFTTLKTISETYTL
jgi:peptidoglycan-N-acetylglucosamine deacetylase